MFIERGVVRQLLERLQRRTGRDGARPAPPSAPTNLGPTAATAAIDGRIMEGQLNLLDSAAWGAISNVLAVIVVALIVGRELSALSIGVWIGAMAAAVAALILWVTAARRDSIHGDLAATARRRRRHVAFAAVIGACWGLPSLGFGVELSAGHMMLLTLIVVSATAACCPALGSYLPAFYGFCLGALLPLAVANLRRADSESEAIAFLIILYLPTLGRVAHSFNRAVTSALRLRAENEVLARNLAASEAATVAAMRSKWDTLAHLSHELRTPMNAIIGFSESMREQIFGVLSPRYRAYSSDINASGRYALDLIDAILEVSRAEAGQIELVEETIDPATFIDECVRMVEAAATDRRVTLTFRSDALPRLIADRAKLRRVLLNLLTNAIKYTPAGGHVSVEARMTDGWLAITVADNGIGIAADDVSRCFEPFVRLSNPLTNSVPGAGLGLPIAKRLIEAHGGTVAIASVPRHGTTVTLRLPAKRCVGGALRLVEKAPPKVA